MFLMGEDVGASGGRYAVSMGLLPEFGPERIRDTPLSDAGFTEAGIGAALAGIRPIMETMTVNFSLLVLDQILNTAATIRHMSGGQFSVPLVIRMATGAGRQLAAQHSHNPENYDAHIPGLCVLVPATLEDARGMLWTALQEPDPVNHHRLGPGRWRGGCAVRGDLPAAGGAGGLRDAAAAGHGAGRRGGGAACRHREPRRRSPRQRRPARRPLPRRDRPPAARAPDPMTRDEIRAGFLAELADIAP
jgi:hypothetical protein